MIDLGLRAAALLAELAHASEDGPGVTRLPFTPQHRQALDLLTAAMQETGLSVRLDAAGTLIGRQEGQTPDAPVLLIGSHQDSVREGGAFDGIMGVVLAIVALAGLREHGIALPFAVEVLAFADEEGVRFPTALVGPRALAGTVDPAVLDMADADGITLRDAMQRFGLAPDTISRLHRDPASVMGYIEVHIEQGPVLEAADQALGVVTAICGIERHQIMVMGETGHAGTLPMEGRRDALLGAAALVTEVNRLARSGEDLRGTVGALTVVPNVVNAVPRAVQMTAELRAPRDDMREAAGQALHRFAAELAQSTGLTIDIRRSYHQPAQPCDAHLTAVLQHAVRATGGRGMTLPSGATHDASAMADLCPMAMLFVRCARGISHSPAEYASPEDMGAAIAALGATLRRLAFGE